jgi:hypothetical protein
MYKINTINLTKYPSASFLVKRNQGKIKNKVLWGIYLDKNNFKKEVKVKHLFSFNSVKPF